jgi:Zn-dependent peptidase ImmA (M78 family)
MMCAARGISTVEQLAKLAKRREVPLEIQELAVRAQSMIAQQANIGKFEAIIRQKEAELAAILEEVRELRMAVAQRDARINSLMTMTAYGQQPGGTVLHG